MIKDYSRFLITERYDINIRRELSKLGVSEEELEELVDKSKRGNLGRYLLRNGKSFTFGMLRAIFLDAQDAKIKTDVKTGVIKAIHRIVPMALAPFFPILAIIGYILGTSRAFNKVIAPILADPGKNYPDFLNKLIVNTMKIAEGEIILPEDKFTKAFVVSDNLIGALKEEVLREFSIYLTDKMLDEDPYNPVPDNYVENELKEYINRNFMVTPPIPIKK